MNTDPPNRNLVLWPVVAIVIAVLVAANPFYAPKISLGPGIAAWLVAMALALICWVNPIAARAGVLLAGLFMAVPCFLYAPPLIRGWLMCGMLLPPAIASVPVLAPSVTGFRSRLAMVCSWDHTRELRRLPRFFDASSLLRLFLATVLFAASLDAVKSIQASGFWFPLRWLAGGVMIFAVAEMWTAFRNFLTAGLGLTVPSLMESPILSTSVSEFWTKRWNPGTSFVFRRFCFEPLAMRSPVFALFAVFILSGAGHVLLFFMATLRWEISLMNGSFFFAQPFFILVERKLNVRRWPTTARRAWTLTVLAIASPLFVEPGLQVVVPILLGMLLLIGLGTVIECLFLAGALISLSGTRGYRSVDGGAGLSDGAELSDNQPTTR